MPLEKPVIYTKEQLKHAVTEIRATVEAIDRLPTDDKRVFIAALNKTSSDIGDVEVAQRVGLYNVLVAHAVKSLAADKTTDPSVLSRLQGAFAMLFSGVPDNMYSPD
jgi:hypothetical protein